jgi:hexosaminidase
MDWTGARSVSPFRGNARNLLKMITYLIPLFASAAFLLTTKSVELPSSEREIKTGRPINVLPLPTRYTTGNKAICLSPDFSIEFDSHVPEDLQKAAQRVERGIWDLKHRYLSIKRGAEFFEEGNGCDYTLSILEVVVDHDAQGHMASIMDSAIRPAEDRPDLEAYTLTIPLGDRAIIKSPTALGAYRGLTTFENLFYHLPADSEGIAEGSKSGVLTKPDSLENTDQLPLGSGGQTDQASDVSETGSRSEVKGKWYAPAAPYEIEDKPAFGWRAVMLDTSRNWFGKESILKVSSEGSKRLIRRCLILWQWSKQVIPLSQKC